MKFLFALLTAFFLFTPLAEADEVRNISPAEAQALREKGVRIVDVRTAMEWQQTGVVEGSDTLTAFLPNGTPNQTFGIDLTTLLNPGEPVIFICRSGRRSAAVSNWLASLESSGQVYNVQGGISRWMGEGNPVTSWSPEK